MFSFYELKKELKDVFQEQTELLNKERRIKEELKDAFNKFCEEHMPDGYYDRVEIRGWGIEDGWRLRKNAKVFIMLNSIGIIEFYPKRFADTEVNYNKLDSLINQHVSESEITELQKIFKEICAD
jgi:Ca2+-binding EF-hand superfamily protein